jgi:hypothetical protein
MVTKSTFARIPDLQFASFTVTAYGLGDYKIVEHDG